MEFTIKTGWWFGFVPIYWEFHHPNWRTHIFFRGVGLNHQPDIISYYSHIPTRYSPSIALLLPAGRPSGTAKTTWDPQSLPALGADLPPGQEPRRSRCHGGASTGDASDVWQGRVFLWFHNWSLSESRQKHDILMDNNGTYMDICLL